MRCWKDRFFSIIKCEKIRNLGTKHALVWKWYNEAEYISDVGYRIEQVNRIGFINIIRKIDKR